MNSERIKRKCLACGKITDAPNYTLVCLECKLKWNEEKFRKLNDLSKNKEND